MNIEIKIVRASYNVSRPHHVFYLESKYKGDTYRTDPLIVFQTSQLREVYNSAKEVLINFIKP